MTELSKHKSIFFVGIGGAGMSALAKVLFGRGYDIGGSDIKASRNTERLRSIGVKIIIGHNRENIKGFDLIVFSSAIPHDNPEMLAAKDNGIMTVRRGELLSWIVNDAYGISVAGTHGKTTTTSMISLMIELCDLSPTFIIGGELNDVGGNAKNGSSNIVICEADESDRSMGLLRPRISVVTNIEEDHLDNFSGMEDIKNLFEDYLGKLSKDDHAVLCGDDDVLRELSSRLGTNVHLYGLGDGNNAVARNFELGNMGSSYIFSYNGKDICEVNLKVPGKHNILNSLAAMSVAHLLDLDLERAADSLKNFSGAQRRFEIKGNNNGVLVVDDYAHHPTEVKATLAAAKIHNAGRVVAIFQPHRYSRVQALYRQFGDAFNDADFIIITDIYSAGEKPIPGVNSKLIVDTVLSSNSRARLAYLPKLKNIQNYLKEHLEPGDMLLTMGAGDVWQVGEEYLEA